MSENKLIIKLIKADLEKCGLIKEAKSQISFIEENLLKLLMLQDADISKIIEDYFNDQEKIKDEMAKLQKELQKKMDEYVENAKAIYEQIKKL